MKEIERLIVDYFEAAGADIVEDGLEWFLSLYDEGPAISLTALAVALSPQELSDRDQKWWELAMRFRTERDGIRSAVIEACAKIADRHAAGWTLTANGLAREDTAEEIAKEIRDLAVDAKEDSGS